MENKVDNNANSTKAVHHLTMRDNGQVVQELPSRGEIRIGRAKGNDLVLIGTKVARHHARIYRQGDVYFVCNVGNANSTWVNGICLIGQRQLRDGDRLTIGDAELTYHSSNRSMAALATAPTTEDIPAPPTARSVNGVRKRRLRFALTPAGVALLIALAAVAIYLLNPGLAGTEQPTSTPTATATMRPTHTAPAPTPARPPATPTAPPRIVSETDKDLAEAHDLALRSEFEEAIIIYQALARLEAGDPRPEVGWAWALLLDNLPDQALLHARRAGELAPDDPEVATVLARAYAAMQDPEQALAWARRAVAYGADDSEAYVALAHAYRLAGQPEEAVAAGNAALEKETDSAQAHSIRGWLHQEVEEDTGQAIDELQTAIELQPELWLWHHELGLLLIEAGAYDEAIVSLTGAMEQRPKAGTLTALGLAHFQLGQYEQAGSFLDQALAAGAWDAKTYALLALLSARQGRCQEARNYYDQALAQEPEQSLALQAQEICPGSQSSASPTATAGDGQAPSAQVLSGRIAFPVWNRAQGHYDVYLAQIDGSDRQLVAEQVHQPAFRPGGDWLAVNGERPQEMNLLIVRPDGSELQEVSAYIEDSLPAWSPDGQGLALSSTRHPDRQSRVYIIDTVQFGGERAEGRILQSDLYEVLGDRPAWLPALADGSSGERIVYNSCDHTTTPAHCGLFVIAAGPGRQTPVALTGHPSDTAPAVRGDRIIFMSNRDGNWEIYIIDADGSNLQRLTHNTANDGLPVWSPTGSGMIAFVSDQGGAWAVWAIEPDGSNRRKLFDLGGGGLAFDWQHERISWGP
jgi:tetratricopeptide (TPR) repeat protein/pSer/pThr/pTyr-binding forkhead associated (FHA) protein